MAEIGAFEAKTQFSRLLARVARGETITITRRGKVVALLTPAHPSHDVEAARRTAGRLRKLARKVNLGRFDWDEWKAYRDQGKR
ncbi:MAG: type II toxin-antitoxin system prevent-host-death family antitoxin [Alphaproteobacteria bacterium]|nr:type II toxin-antitoxin system prevent-host-death family antitoxin [Alphaproteobacteria bacterium]